MIHQTALFAAMMLSSSSFAAPPPVALWSANQPLPTQAEFDARSLEIEDRLAERMERMRSSRGGCGVTSTDLENFEDIVALATSGLYEADRIVYIDSSAPLGGDGSSWNSAYQSIQDALGAEVYDSDLVEFRLAGGTYRADTFNGFNTIDPEQSIELPGMTWVNSLDGFVGIKSVKGGYAGRGAKNPDHRDLDLFPTVFTGDLLGDDDPESFANYADNTKVLFLPNETELNGITIEHARVAAHELRWMTDCTVRYCFASGDDLPMVRHDRSPVLARDARIVGNTFHNNRAEAYGGALTPRGLTVVIANSRFLKNQAPGGGAIGATFTDLSLLAVQNCYFASNISNGDLGGIGGAVFLRWGSPEFAHCTFVGNIAVDGGGLGAISSEIAPRIFNCIFDQNYAFNGTGLGAEVELGTNLASATIKANVFRAFNDNAQLNPAVPIELNLGADAQFVDLLGPDGVLGTLDDDPAIATDSPAIGRSVSPLDGPLRIALLDPADLDGDCDVSEPLPIDLLGHPRAIESVPGEGIDGYAADAGCAEYVPGDEPTTGQPWSFVDPLITDFSTDPIRLYVRSDAMSGGDGLAWETAFSDLCEAIDVAGNRLGSVEIWVSAGVYRAACERSGLRAFRVRENVALLGGFAGDETSADQRDWIANPTVLTGDLLGNDDPDDPATLEDNAPHVMLSSGPRGGGLVDGFTIQDGVPQGYTFGPGLFRSFPVGLGGEVTAGLVYHASGDLAIRNCTFGGMPSANASIVALAGQRANLEIFDSRITSVDSATQPAAFLMNDRVTRSFQSMEGFGRVLLDHCDVSLVISALVNPTWKAGAITLERSRISRSGRPDADPPLFAIISEAYQPVTIRDCEFRGNSTIFATNIQITNSTFYGGRSGAVLRNIPFVSSSSSIANSVFVGIFGTGGFGTRQVTGSVFQLSTDPELYEPFGDHNTTFDFEANAADFFVDPLGPDGEPYTGDEDLRLAPASPAINTGRNAFVESDFDLDGNDRIIGSVVDRGAYEFTGTCTGDVNGDGVIDLADLNMVLANFNQPVPFGDADGSGSVDMTDLNIVIGAFGQNCDG
jgi:hypothetical protein